jgi:hypothetical protein
MAKKNANIPSVPKQTSTTYYRHSEGFRFTASEVRNICDLACALGSPITPRALSLKKVTR